MSSRSVIVRDEKGNVIIMDEFNHRTKLGEVFQSDAVVEALADDAVVIIQIRVPTGFGCTLRTATRSGGNCRLKVYENPTITGDGTPIIRVNRDRSSSKVTDILAFHTPSISDFGTLISDTVVSPADVDGNSSEWVLKPNEDYLILSLNISGAAQDTGLTTEWYQIGATAP